MNIEWQGTSFKVGRENGEFIKLLNDLNIRFRDNDSDITIENLAEYFIFENEFVEQTTNISQALKKYIKKKYSDEVKVYVSEKNDIDIIEVNSSDLIKYVDVVKNNVVDGDVRDLNISINVLSKVLNKSKKSKLFLDILIMFALANRVKYDAENVKIEFHSSDRKYQLDIGISTADNINLYPIYDWIFNDEEYKDSYSVKLHIVRQIITNKRSIENIDEILQDSKLAYNRIISNKTTDYFKQINQLKEDFLRLTNNENSALRTLNLTFFAWIGYLGVELFKIIVNYKGNNILGYLLFSSGAKKAIVISGFIIALIFIYLCYFSEIKSLKRIYEIIKKTYRDKLLFEVTTEESGKFESIVSEPKIGAIQKWIFGIILICLIIRFFVACGILSLLFNYKL